MAIMGRHADPWGEETGFESLTVSNPASTQVKKAVTDAIKIIGQDVKSQFTEPVKVDNPESLPEKNHPVPENHKEQLLAQTRQNLLKIDAEIKKAREEREKKYQEKLKMEKKEQEKKVAEVQQKKKQEDSLQASIRRSQGSGERGKVAG